MHTQTRLKLVTAAASLFLALGASATTYNEIGDAGQLMGTAQVLGGGITQVNGNVAGNESDLYKFAWGGGAFYVNSVGSTYDSQLFLFDSNGVGVQGNDDGIAYAGPAYLQLGALAAGNYFLGISWYDWDPYSAAGMIFQSNPYQPLYGPLNNSPLSYWSGSNFYGLASYEIHFGQTTGNGTQGPTNPTGNVPDGGTSAALLGLGVAGLALIRRRKA